MYQRVVAFTASANPSFRISTESLTDSPGSTLPMPPQSTGSNDIERFAVGRNVRLRFVEFVPGSVHEVRLWSRAERATERPHVRLSGNPNASKSMMHRPVEFEGRSVPPHAGRDSGPVVVPFNTSSQTRRTSRGSPSGSMAYHTRSTVREETVGEPDASVSVTVGARFGRGQPTSSTAPDVPTDPH